MAEAALAPVRFPHQRLQAGLHPLQHRHRHVAELEIHLGPARDDAEAAGIQGDPPRRPGAARAADLRELPVDRRQQPHRREARIPALRHGGAAGMVLVAGEIDPELPDRHDAAHHAEMQAGGFELRPLLDVHLQEAAVAGRVEPHPGQAGEAGTRERRAKRRAVGAVAGLVHLGLGQVADRRAAAQEAAGEVPLLVREGDDVDGQPGAGQRHPGHDAQRPVEPAGLVLRLDVAADQQVRAGAAVAPQHVADPVDGSVQAADLEPGHQPAAGFHVRGREGRPVDAGAEPADLAQLVQVGQEGSGVDRGHGAPRMMRPRAVQAPCG